MTLIELLQDIPEFRHLQGRMYELWFILLMMIVGGMCGYWGYRPLEEFCHRYGAEFCRELGIPEPTRMPTYSTFRRIIVNLDFEHLSTVFNQWAQQYVPIESGEWISTDGKSIKGSVENYDNAQQNFVMLVSLFSHQRGVVLHSQPMESKKGSEQHLVQQIVQTFDLKGAVLTADALHCQKKRCKHSKTKGPTTCSV